jgi:hypothetical protein
MSELELPTKLVSMIERGRISDDDVRYLRQDYFKDSKLCKTEAESLFALDAAVKDKSHQWDEFFIEAMVDHLVNQAEPVGHISEDNAEWLKNCISRNGLVDGPVRLEMLVKVLEVAKSAPESLLTFAMTQVSEAVLNNQGPLVASRLSEKLVICKSDVELLRRMIFGFGSDNGLAVSKAEAEFLFNLNDQTAEYENDPTWNDLFVRAVGNYLLATLDGAQPSRAAVLSKDTFLQGDGLFDGAVNTLKSVLAEMRPLHRVLDSERGVQNKELASSFHQAAKVTPDEAAWVIERIQRDGEKHENEKALLAFIKEEASELHASLSSAA